jgi:hypothetical protein
MFRYNHVCSKFAQTDPSLIDSSPIQFTKDTMSWTNLNLSSIFMMKFYYYYYYYYFNYYYYFPDLPSLCPHTL